MLASQTSVEKGCGAAVEVPGARAGLIGPVQFILPGAFISPLNKVVSDALMCSEPAPAERVALFTAASPLPPKLFLTRLSHLVSSECHLAPGLKLET